MQVVRTDDVAVLAASGELDMATAPGLAAALDAQLLTGVRMVVVDLTAVTFLGSPGIAVLLDFANRAGEREPDVRVRLVAGESQRAVRRPWDAMRLDAVLPLFPDVDAAER